MRKTEDRPLIPIAGGTGFSYVRSISLTALARTQMVISPLTGWPRREAPLRFLQLEALSVNDPNLRIEPVVEQPGEGWRGRSGRCHRGIPEDGTLAGHDIYIAGRFEIGGIARDRSATSVTRGKIVVRRCVCVYLRYKKTRP
ncbi:hypothetical protein ACNKHO_24605 [Shigella flexneri]